MAIYVSDINESYMDRSHNELYMRHI